MPPFQREVERRAFCDALRLNLYQVRSFHAKVRAPVAYCATIISNDSVSRPITYDEVLAVIVHMLNL